MPLTPEENVTEFTSVQMPASWGSGGGHSLFDLWRHRFAKLVTASFVPAGTSTSSFTELWAGAPPETALVIEDSTPKKVWVSVNYGGSWEDVTGNVPEATGNMKLSINSTETGYLLCDGSFQLIASYPTLSALLTTRYGAATIAKWIQLEQTAWTSTSQATFRFRAQRNGIVNGMSVDLLWGTSSRTSMTVSSATSSTFVLSGGSGDSIPSSTTTEFYWRFASTYFALPDARGAYLGFATNMTNSTALDSSRREGIITKWVRSFARNSTSDLVNYGGNVFLVNIFIKT